MSSEYIHQLPKSSRKPTRGCGTRSCRKPRGWGKGGKGIGVLLDVTEGRGYLWMKKHLIALQPQTLSQL